MEVSLIQLDISWESPMENYTKVESLLKRTSPSVGSLVLLPEMFPTGFSMNGEKLSYTGMESPESFLSRSAHDLKCWISAGVGVLNSDGKFYNQQIVLNPEGDCIARYSKIRLFKSGGEDVLFHAGSEVVMTSINEWRVAPLICYDLRFPELFREVARKGAELFLVVANWPTTRLEHWRIMLQSRAIENQAFVIGVNRCGSDPDRDYPGHSMVIGPQGEILAEAGEEEVVLRAEIDRQKLLSWRKEFSALRDFIERA
ncbi:MAG: carbon-nitrogen family hydrolase [Chthoniobacterales bacterium]